MVELSQDPAPDNNPNQQTTGTATPPAPLPLKEAFMQFARSADHAIGEAGAAVVREAGHVRDGAVTLGKQAAGTANEIANEAIRILAGDPNVPRSTLQQVMVVMPILGTSAIYARAHVKFHTGKSSGDEKLVQEGLRECLMAYGSLGLDAVGAVGPLARAFPKASRFIMSAVRAVIGSHNTDSSALDRKVDEMLKNPKWVAVAEKALNAIRPTAPKAEAV